MPAYQQAEAWIRSQDQHLRRTVQNDGEYHQVSIHSRHKMFTK